MIPDDVTVQVLTQAREHIIRKTFDALKGVKNAIVHVYNSTSFAQRQQVFRKSKEEIKQIAVDGAKLLQRLTDEAGANFRFEYSPESFTGTEPEYALEVCNAVLDVWKPTADRKAIINLPSTVQMSMPHVFASQIAYMSQNLKYRDNVILSVHPHNDRGTGVADAEMAMLVGADRVEGTLFGNGVRTGNADIVTIGMNMYALGVDPGLDFSNMPKLVETYERVTHDNHRVSLMPASWSSPLSPVLIRTPSPRACTSARKTTNSTGPARTCTSIRMMWAARTMPTSSASTASPARAA